MTLFEEIISESTLLTELTKNAEPNVIAAINGMRRVRMTYNDGEKDRKGKNERIILPFAYGEGTNGKMMVSAYQVGWSTKRGLTKTEATPEGNRWKYFEYDKIVSWSNQNKKFTEEDIADATAANDFNPNGDKRFKSFIAISPLHAGYHGQIEASSAPIDDKPIKKSDIQHVNVQPSQMQPAQKNQQVQPKTVDNNNSNEYIPNEFEAPDAKPITKTEIDGTQPKVSTDTVVDTGNVEAPRYDKPITKAEVDNEEPQNDENSNEEEEAKSVSEVKRSFNSLMERMNNLNKDN